jgi:hypothetical protein
MSLGPLSDKEIIARDERSYRALFTLVVTFLLLMGTIILLIFATRKLGIPTWVTSSTEVVLLMAWLLFIFDRVKPGMAPPDEAFGEEYLRKTIDLQHRRRRYVIVFTLAGLCNLAYILIRTLLHGDIIHSDLGPITWVFSGIALLGVLTVAFGPGFFLPYYRRALNDELTRTQHAKVAQLGYILVVMEMCAILVTAVYKPLWIIAALPFAVAMAITIPGIYFLVLEWWASRSG